MIWFPDKKDGAAPCNSHSLGTMVLLNLKGLDDHMRCYWIHDGGCLVVNHLEWQWSHNTDDDDDDDDRWPLLDVSDIVLGLYVY